MLEMNLDNNTTIRVDRVAIHIFPRGKPREGTIGIINSRRDLIEQIVQAISGRSLASDVDPPVPGGYSGEQKQCDHPGVLPTWHGEGWECRCRRCGTVGYGTDADAAEKSMRESPYIESDPPESKHLALDVSLEQARALHRVWRALNDGDCPKCHKFHAATEIIRSAYGITCPSCRFVIAHSEIEAIEKLFAPAMDGAVAIFEKWRAAQ